MDTLGDLMNTSLRDGEIDDRLSEEDLQEWQSNGDTPRAGESDSEMRDAIDSDEEWIEKTEFNPKYKKDGLLLKVPIILAFSDATSGVWRFELKATNSAESYDPKIIYDEWFGYESSPIYALAREVQAAGEGDTETPVPEMTIYLSDEKFASYLPGPRGGPTESSGTFEYLSLDLIKELTNDWKEANLHFRKNDHPNWLDTNLDADERSLPIIAVIGPDRLPEKGLMFWKGKNIGRLSPFTSLWNLSTTSKDGKFPKNPLKYNHFYNTPLVAFNECLFIDERKASALPSAYNSEERRESLYKLFNDLDKIQCGHVKPFVQTVALNGWPGDLVGIEDTDIGKVAERYLRNGKFTPGYLNDHALALMLYSERRKLPKPSGRSRRAIIYNPIALQTMLVSLNRYQAMTTDLMSSFAFNDEYNAVKAGIYTFSPLVDLETILKKMAKEHLAKVPETFTTKSIEFRNTPTLGPRLDEDFQMLICPVNEKDIHWYLLVYFFDTSMKRYVRLYIDSLDNFANYEMMATIFHGIESFLRITGTVPMNTTFVPLKLRVPEQEGVMCGMNAISRAMTIEFEAHTIDPSSAELSMETIVSKWNLTLTEVYNNRSFCYPRLEVVAQLDKYLADMIAITTKDEGNREGNHEESSDISYVGPPRGF